MCVEDSIIFSRTADLQSAALLETDPFAGDL